MPKCEGVQEETELLSMREEMVETIMRSLEGYLERTNENVRRLKGRNGRFRLINVFISLEPYRRGRRNIPQML